MNRTIKSILLIICLAIFILSAYNIYKYIKEEKTSKKYNNELIEKAISKVSDNNKTADEESKKSEYELPINIDFDILQQENEDIVGWIYLKDSPINYPVVQSNDNNYYLHRLINGEYNTAGSIFMDYRNKSNLEDNNTIIYGHNMKNNTMFGSLQEYESQEYYNNHKIIYYFTPEKNYIIELFAGCTVSVESDIYNLSDIDEAKIADIINKSDFMSEIDIEKNDKIITLSTCAYDYSGARYVVMGVLKEIS